ncbi:TniQ family protein [Paraburkholderia tropica]|nr:TniQ family protein [Paraburkholderia tropica]
MTSPFRSRLPGGWPEDAPSRSILYSLAPYGCSGEDRESLGSYLTRLCEAYEMTRWTLTNTIVGPAAEELLHVSGDRMSRDVGRAAYRLNVSGLTEQVSHWAYTLNHLTGRDNLQLCTLLPLRSLVSDFVLQVERERFCPECFEEDVRRKRDCYGRLLWTIDAVKACPLHQLQLVGQPQAKQRRGVFRSETGCTSQRSTTQHKIGESPIQQPASDFDVETSRLIAELLDDVVIFSQAGYSASAQTVFLTHAINHLFEGSPARFSAHLGINKSQTHGWVKGTVQMSFTRLVQTAFCCGCAIADILLGNRVVLSLRPMPDEQRRRLTNRRVSGARRANDVVRAELEELIRSGDATNATGAATAVGISLKFLRANFPEQHERLVRLGRERAESVRREATEAFNEMYLSEANALRAAGVYPSRRLVLGRLEGKVMVGRFRRIQNAHRNALAATGMSNSGGERRPVAIWNQKTEQSKF